MTGTPGRSAAAQNWGRKSVRPKTGVRHEPLATAPGTTEFVRGCGPLPGKPAHERREEPAGPMKFQRRKRRRPGESSQDSAVDQLAEPLKPRDADLLQVTLEVVAADHRGPDGPAGEEPRGALLTGELNGVREQVGGDSG